MTERDEILKALRDVPGVYNSEDIHFSKSIDDRNRTIIYLTHRGIMLERYTNPATLAEAVAALTPPSQPKPPTYEFVTGIKGASPWGMDPNRNDRVQFLNLSGAEVEFWFREHEGLRVYFDHNVIATPQTEDEVLATLRMCRVEVGE